MFKSMYNVLSQLFFRNSKVSYLRKKQLTAIFKNSLDKKISIINLDLYRNFTFKVTNENDVTDNIIKFNLIMDGTPINSENNTTETIILGKFETRKEAEQAKDFIINKNISIGLSIIKTFVWTILGFFMLITLQQILFSSSNTNNVATNNNSYLSQELIEKLQKQQQLQLQAQSKITPNQTKEVVNDQNTLSKNEQIIQEGSKYSNELINGMKK